MGKARAVRKRPQVTLDTGALIAIDRGDRRMVALLDLIAKQGGKFRVPAGVLGQAWRSSLRQANLSRFLASSEVEIVPLTESLSRACGELLAATGTSDVIDASVVLVARENFDPIVTSDVGAIARLDPKAKLAKI